MGATNGLKEATGVTAPVASNTLSVNVFTAPGKPMVGERPKPFGEALGFDPITSTLIFGEHDAVLVDAMTTVAEAEALADYTQDGERPADVVLSPSGAVSPPALSWASAHQVGCT